MKKWKLKSLNCNEIMIYYTATWEHVDTTNFHKTVINIQILKKSHYTWCGNDDLAACQNGQQKIIMNVN